MAFIPRRSHTDLIVWGALSIWWNMFGIGVAVLRSVNNRGNQLTPDADVSEWKQLDTASKSSDRLRFLRWKGKLRRIHRSQQTYLYFGIANAAKENIGQESRASAKCLSVERGGTQVLYLLQSLCSMQSGTLREYR